MWRGFIVYRVSSVGSDYLNKTNVVSICVALNRIWYQVYCYLFLYVVDPIGVMVLILIQKLQSICLKGFQVFALPGFVVFLAITSPLLDWLLSQNWHLQSLRKTSTQFWWEINSLKIIIFSTFGIFKRVSQPIEFKKLTVSLTIRVGELK